MSSDEFSDVSRHESDDGDTFEPSNQRAKKALARAQKQVAESKRAAQSRVTRIDGIEQLKKGRRKRPREVESEPDEEEEAVAFTQPPVQDHRVGMFDSDDGEDDDDATNSDNSNDSATRPTGSSFLKSLLSLKPGRPVKDLSSLSLKADHASRPLWIDNHGRITLERFSPIAEQAQDFLVAIAEPVSRPTFVHEYRVNEYSLYAAMSVGLETNDIIEVLSRLSKTPLPNSLVRDINRWTAAYGKVKLVLKRNRYYLESSVPEMIRRLLSDEKIRASRVVAGTSVQQVPKPTNSGLVIPGTEQARQAAAAAANPNADTSTIDNTDPANNATTTDPTEDTLDIDLDDRVQSFEISPNRMETVKKQCQLIGLPVLEEYDFRADNINRDLDVDLKPLTVIREYQETSLSKMFGNGRARSGIIVLPCGAGKTLVGITAACTIKKSVLVLCTSA